jgi:putative MFS transporter
LAVEIFPTELRASAAGIATAVSRLGAALSAALFPLLERFWGLPAVLVMMALVSATGAAVTVRYAVESRQKTLENLESEE